MQTDRERILEQLYAWVAQGIHPAEIAHALAQLVHEFLETGPPDRAFEDLALAEQDVIKDMEALPGRLRDLALDLYDPRP